MRVLKPLQRHPYAHHDWESVLKTESRQRAPPHATCICAYSSNTDIRGAILSYGWLLLRSTYHIRDGALPPSAAATPGLTNGLIISRWSLRRHWVPRDSECDFHAVEITCRRLPARRCITACLPPLCTVSARLAQWWISKYYYRANAPIGLPVSKPCAAN